jgi:uncharacterized protein YkwD
MATPLRSRQYRVGAKAFGMSAPERDSPKVFAPEGTSNLTFDKMLRLPDNNCMTLKATTATVLQEKRSKGLFDFLNGWREFSRISKLHGGLVPVSVVSTILGVTRQRVHQLVEEGTFSHWTFYGKKWVSQDEVVAFAKLNRQAGENQFRPSVKELWKASKEHGKEFVKARREHGS